MPACKTECSIDDFKSKVRTTAIDLMESLSNVMLPDDVNAAIEKVSESERTEQREAGSEPSEEDWTHFTYATSDNQFKLDRKADGTWKITSDLVYFGDQQQINRMEPDELLFNASRDAALLVHLVEHGKNDDVDRFLEQ